MTTAYRGVANRRFPCLRLARAGVLLLLVAVLGWTRLVDAGTVYRCKGPHGETVYTGSVEQYRQCSRVASFATPPPAAGARRAGKDPRKPSLQGVTASVSTTAVAAGVGPAADGPRPAPGQWSYAESGGDDASAMRGGQNHAALAAVEVAAGSGNKVLHGAVYRIVRADGSVEYTNLPSSRRRGRATTLLFTYIATCVACNLHSPIDWGTVALDFDSYGPAIRSASAEFGVDQALLRAVIHAESAFNPQALSLKGAQGLMQLMPSTAMEMGVRDAFDAEQNIRGGARYLAILLRDFRGDERLAAAAYNAGERAVLHYNGVPPYAETRVYVERVGTLRQRYGEAGRRGG